MATDTSISSAEMTAYWRSVFPTISLDPISIRMASQAGIDKAEDIVMQLNYPLLPKKISVRARYMFDNAVKLLQTGNYDACISFASGFSLLISLIKNAFPSTSIQFFDTDLPHMMIERKNRLLQLQHEDLISAAMQWILDLELAAKNKLRLTELFPNINTPVFILEGIIYFLTPHCVSWLIKEIKNYTTAAVILDFFPASSLTTSAMMRNGVEKLANYMPEKIQDFIWDEKQLADFQNGFNSSELKPIQIAEREYSTQVDLPVEFSDPNDFFPAMLMTVS